MILYYFILILYPTHAASRPITMLAVIYIKVVISCPPFSMSRFSCMKVENVVNPPQKPAIKSRRVGLFTGIMRERTPMMKQPSKLAVNVPKGCLPFPHTDNIQRQTPPIPDPMNTAKIL